MLCDRDAGERGGIPMDFYERWILPPILDLVMRRKDLTKYRRAAVAAAHGRVLEIGVGSGLNFPLYGKQVEFVYGIDPSSRLLAIARRRAAASGVPVELLLGSAIAIPLADDAIDPVVMTWTLCSIPDPLAAGDAEGAQTMRQSLLCRARAFARAKRRTLAAAPDYSGLAPDGGRLSSRPQD